MENLRQNTWCHSHDSDQGLAENSEGMLPLEHDMGKIYGICHQMNG